MNQINQVQNALNNISNDDENLEKLEAAMEHYCGTFDKCEGYKQAIMLTIADEYENHASEQDPKQLETLLYMLK